MQNHLKDINILLRDKYNNQIKDLKDLISGLKLLSNGYPLDYIIGYTYFLNCKIDLSFKPLIPRIETEYQIYNNIPVFKSHFKNYKNIKVLDIFSGSGCIGIGINKNLNNTKIDFSDINSKYISQIKLNLKLNHITKDIKVIQSDIFSNLKSKYDLILANPPYVPTTDTIKAPFEDKKAIMAGKDGLKVIEPFIKGLSEHLNPNALVFMEFHPLQKSKIEKLLKQNGFSKYLFQKDQYKRWRSVIIYS